MLTVLSMQTGAIVALCVAAGVLLLGAIIFFVYIHLKNGLVMVVNQTEESWASMDVFLKKRYDLIPNLVEVVKGYAKHESETLEKVVTARNIAGAATGDEKIDAEKAFGAQLTQFMNMVVERYPDLKANAQFSELSATLRSIENELAQARKYYNGNCRNYNNKIQMFPTSIVARKMGLKKKAYYEIDSAEERRAPQVKF